MLSEFASESDSLTHNSKFFCNWGKKLSWNSDLNFCYQESYIKTWEALQDVTLNAQHVKMMAGYIFIIYRKSYIIWILLTTLVKYKTTLRHYVFMTLCRGIHMDMEFEALCSTWILKYPTQSRSHSLFTLFSFPSVCSSLTKC